MKKVILSILLIYLVGATYAINLSGCYKRYFKVSAYYSPIAKQSVYYRGNYYAEIKLNGRGIRGASGKRVFNGMLAGPKKYKFGTKIYFPGLGVGAIEDRGNAIVSAGDKGQRYDRIDIWVGKGDKALMRALSFGKHVRIGYVCPKYKKLKVGFNYNKFPIFSNFFQKTIWGIGLFMGRHDAWVKVLQIYLKELGYFHYRTTGYFGPITKQALTRFQKDNGIKTKYYGYFGPKTRQKLKDILKKKGLYKENHIKKMNIIKTKQNKTKQIKKIKKDLTFLKRGLCYGYKTYEVKILQIYLAKLGYYKGQINGYYNEKTLKAVAKFQIKHDIISKQNAYLAGYFGPKTRTVFKKIIQDKFIDL